MSTLDCFCSFSIAFGRLSFLLPALAAGTACASGEEDRPAATVRDSAGIEIVENAAAVYPSPQWGISQEPALAIGVLEGDPDYQLYQVRDAVRLADGRIVIANGGTHELRWYGADGQFIRSAGGEGGGPGEFEGMGSLGRYGTDSLMVYDWRHRRVSVFDTAGAFARSFMVDLGSGTFPNVVGQTEDGRLLVSSGATFGGESEAGLDRRSQTYWVVGPDGEIRDSLGTFEGAEYWVKREGGRMAVTSRAFTARSVVELAHAFYYVGHTGRAELALRRIGADSVVRLVRWPVPDAPVTAEHITEYERERIEGAEERWRDMQRELLEGMPYPDRFPSFGTVRLDPTNHLWVRQYEPPGEGAAPWWIFDPDGRLLFELPAPDGVRVVDIGRDYVLGIYEDEFEVEHLLMYDLERGTRG